jgi:hypothetical protein
MGKTLNYFGGNNANSLAVSCEILKVTIVKLQKLSRHFGKSRKESYF